MDSAPTFVRPATFGQPSEGKFSTAQLGASLILLVISAKPHRARAKEIL
jgi:hypothetical protein